MSKANDHAFYSRATNSSDQARDWAITMTKTWSTEVQNEWRLKQRRQDSKRFRLRKKRELLQLRRDQDHLEQQVKLRLAALRREEMNRKSSFKPASSNEMCNVLCRLAIEGDALMSETVKLRQKLQTLKHFQLLTCQEMDKVTARKSGTTSENVLEMSLKSRWVSYARHRGSGWQVYFTNEDPSFYFHPFTRADIDDGIENFVSGVDRNRLRIKPVGTMLGWKLYYAPCTQSEETGALIAHATFTTRICCSLEDADAAVSSSDVNSWPLLFTPPRWQSGQYGSVSTQVLQQFDVNSHVMVTNIRGQFNVRYLHLDMRWPKIEKNGKRGVSYIAAIADTKANASSRAAESDANVQWVHQSGYCIKFTEVNKTTIDVAYDRYSQCESEAHAQLLFVDWAQVVCRWSQRMTSSKLIEASQ